MEVLVKIRCQDLLVVMVALLSACDGDNAVTDSSASQNIEGVWDMSEDVGGDQDIGYVVVRLDGTVSEYDYLGDSVNNNALCYFKDDFILTHEGNNPNSATYEKEFSSNIKFSVQYGSLKITGREFSGENFSNLLPAAGLSESDLVPVCPDDFVI